MILLILHWVLILLLIGLVFVALFNDTFENMAERLLVIFIYSMIIFFINKSYEKQLKIYNIKELEREQKREQIALEKIALAEKIKQQKIQARAYKKEIPKIYSFIQSINPNLAKKMQKIKLR